jgi:nitronate monooxygenase
MWQHTRITRKLGIDFPIVQGPFGGGLSSVELLTEVSEAGGLGSFGVHHLSSEQIVELSAQIRSRTRKPFALNLWVSNRDPGGESLTQEQFDRAIESFRPYYDELGIQAPAMPENYGEDFEAQVEAILECRPAVFSFVFGIPSPDILEQCRRAGIVTLGAVTTLDEALAMENAGVDVIVASGFEAGGHRVSFLRPAEDSLTGTVALIPQIVDGVKAPVIAAGGIADARGVVAALSLGAEAVQIGTAFLACEESNASELHRAELRSERAKYTLLTRAFSGRLARGIRNRLAEELSSNGPALPYPIQNWLTASFKAAATQQRRADLVSLWAGQAAPLIKHRRARDLFQSLVSGTEKMLKDRG